MAAPPTSVRRGRHRPTCRTSPASSSGRHTEVEWRSWGTATAATSRSRWRRLARTSSAGSSSTKRRCPGSTGGREPPPARQRWVRRVPATRRRRSCAGWSVTRRGNACRRRRSSNDERRGRRWSPSWPTCVVRRLGRPVTCGSRCWLCTASTVDLTIGRRWSISVRRCRTAGSRWCADCGHAGPHTNAGAVAEPIVRFVRSLAVPSARAVTSGG